MRKRYDKFYAYLYHLQFGDTFKIKAALINNDQSVLPAEIYNFERYQPLLVACTTDSIRLADTPEGVKKKQELQDQRSQQEQDERANKKKAQNDAKWRKRKEKIQQFFGDSPYINQIATSIIGGLIAGIILTTVVEPIPRLFRWIFSLF